MALSCFVKTWEIFVLDINRLDKAGEITSQKAQLALHNQILPSKISKKFNKFIWIHLFSAILFFTQEFWF